MNENLNLVEILKDCPKGTKLYSPIFGEVELVNVLQGEDVNYPIEIKLHNNLIKTFTNGGRLLVDYDGECTLFPSREERNWSNFKPKQPKFDPKTLQPFDRVLVKVDSYWRIELFFNMYEYMGDICYECTRGNYKECIPYNEDTKHLLCTKKEAPEFYKYWED